MKMIDDVPRRSRLDLVTDEEKDIFDLTQKIEALGAHPLLTEVVTKLQEARDTLADWVESELDE